MIFFSRKAFHAILFLQNYFHLCRVVLPSWWISQPLKSSPNPCHILCKATLHLPLSGLPLLTQLNLWLLLFYLQHLCNTSILTLVHLNCNVLFKCPFPPLGWELPEGKDIVFIIFKFPEQAHAWHTTGWMNDELYSVKPDKITIYISQIPTVSLIAINILCLSSCSWKYLMSTV